jgi:hypothetical protein
MTKISRINSAIFAEDIAVRIYLLEFFDGSLQSPLGFDGEPRKSRHQSRDQVKMRYLVFCARPHRHPMRASGAETVCSPLNWRVAASARTLTQIPFFMCTSQWRGYDRMFPAGQIALLV